MHSPGGRGRSLPVTTLDCRWCVTRQEPRQMVTWLLAIACDHCTELCCLCDRKMIVQEMCHRHFLNFTGGCSCGCCGSVRLSWLAREIHGNIAEECIYGVRQSYRSVYT